MPVQNIQIDPNLKTTFTTLDNNLVGSEIVSLPTGVSGEFDILGRLTGFRFDVPSLENGATVEFVKDGYSFAQVIELVNLEIPVEDADCCNKKATIVWINRIGGYEAYSFFGRRAIMEIEDGDNNQFKTSRMVRKFSNINNVYVAKIVSTGAIDKSHLINLLSLRNSIQAWEITEEGDLIPILIDREKMVLFDTNEKIIQRTIRYIHATELMIQNQ